MTYTVNCIYCGKDVELEYIIETHKVHNGIGMQIVGYDEYTEILDQCCDCELDTNDLDNIVDDTIEEYGRYDELL